MSVYDIIHNFKIPCINFHVHNCELNVFLQKAIPHHKLFFAFHSSEVTDTFE